MDGNLDGKGGKDDNQDDKDDVRTGTSALNLISR
jgi:hypothetical protein